MNDLSITNFELFQILTNLPLYSFILVRDYAYIIDVQTTFYPTSGNIESITPFINGKKHGLHQGWYENGSLDYEYHYVDGKEHGICKSWYENGTLMYKDLYINGKLHGISMAWYENGNLMY